MSMDEQVIAAAQALVAERDDMRRRLAEHEEPTVPQHRAPPSL